MAYSHHDSEYLCKQKMSDIHNHHVNTSLSDWSACIKTLFFYVRLAQTSMNECLPRIFRLVLRSAFSDMLSPVHREQFGLKQTHHPYLVVVVSNNHTEGPFHHKSDIWFGHDDCLQTTRNRFLAHWSSPVFSHLDRRSNVRISARESSRIMLIVRAPAPRPPRNRMYSLSHRSVHCANKQNSHRVHIH